MGQGIIAGRRRQKKGGERALASSPWKLGNDYCCPWLASEQLVPPVLPSIMLVPKHLVVPVPVPMPLTVLAETVLRVKRMVVPAPAFTPVALFTMLLPSRTPVAPLISSWNPTPPFFERFVLKALPLHPVPQATSMPSAVLL